MISAILTLALIGVIVWFIETYLPISAPIKTLIRVVVAICVIVYLMQLFGIADLPVPRR